MFNVSNVSKFIDLNNVLRTNVNNVCGEKTTNSVAPILQRLYENATTNASKKSKNSNRHDVVIKKFACALYCLVGKGGYELLANNLGSALPCLRTVLREISLKKRVNEGEFQCDELKQNLSEWNSPPFVHIQLDDTRIIHKIEYDQLTNLFVGFCLPLQNDS